MLTNSINSSITPLNGVIVGFCSSVRFISADEFCVRVNYAENCWNEKNGILVYGSEADANFKFGADE